MRLLLPAISANWNGSKTTKKQFMIQNAMMYCVSLLCIVVKELS